MKSPGLTVSAVILGIVAGGCSGEPPLTAALKRGDSKACVDRGVREDVEALIDDIREDALPLPTVPQAAFREALMFAVDPRTVTMGGFDEETKRMQCEGTLTFAAGDEIVERAVVYSVIPTADGRDQRITLENFGEIEAFIASEKRAFWSAYQARMQSEQDENWVDPAVRLNGVVQGK